MAYIIPPGERFPRQEIDSLFSYRRFFPFSLLQKFMEISFGPSEPFFTEISQQDKEPEFCSREYKGETFGAIIQDIKEPYYCEKLENMVIRESIPFREGKAKFEFHDLELRKKIEEQAIETWHYLAMKSGAGLLVEVRPEKCFFRNERLSDRLVIYDGVKRMYRLNTNLLEQYLGEHTNCNVQVHLPDLLLDPKTGDYELFSITTGDLEKANIFLELARFLTEYNKGAKTVLPVHLPYFEKWPTKRGVKIFGSLNEDGKRDAVINADRVLRFLLERWPENVILALETGSGEVVKNELLSYALIYELPYLQFLTRGRNNVAICEDVAHLNLVDADWADYLIERIAEFHVSGNDGKNDVHSIATPKTLKCYHELVSFLKFYSGVVCAEIKRGSLSLKDYIDALKELALSIFSLPTEQDFNKLMVLEQRIREKFPESRGIDQENLNECYDLYLRWRARSF